MSDRFSTLIVVLDRDVHEDGIESLKNAIQMLYGVASVKANITNYDDYAARARVKSNLRDKIFALWKALDE